MSMSTKPSDADLAQAVRGAVNILNDALRKAHDAGLRTEITDAAHHTVARLDPLRIYHVEVYRTI